MSSNRRKTVFISGSAYEYGKLGETGKTFVRDLTQTLVKNDFKIISGFGSGVGTYIIEGALQEIYLEKKGSLQERLGVYPFPVRTIDGTDTRAETTMEHSATIWKDYRTDMISQAGTAIFLFGNKLEDIAVREAEGMLQEFEIAKNHQALLIPVGASGYTAEKLWKNVFEKYDDYFETRENFELYQRLGDPGTGPEELIELILQISLSTIPQTAL